MAFLPTPILYHDSTAPLSGETTINPSMKGFPKIMLPDTVGMATDFLASTDGSGTSSSHLMTLRKQPGIFSQPKHFVIKHKTRNFDLMKHFANT